MTPEQTQGLDVARALTAAGVPVFVAYPDQAEPTGYKLPLGWQHTTPDPAVVDTWQPGQALGAVMGQGLDLLDVDPRSGGDITALGTQPPTSYGAALTPSGGVHSFIRTMGVRSRDNVLPGIDVKAGDGEGKGRGFAFIAPTVRISKTTGQPTAYRWVAPPDTTRLAAALADPQLDTSGAGLFHLIAAARAGAGGDDGTIGGFLKTGPWKDIAKTLEGGRNNGVSKLAAALRGRGGWKLDDAVEFMYARVWPLIDQSGHEFGAGEFESTIAAAWRQYADGGEERAAVAAVPPQQTPDGEVTPPDPSRYFGPGGLQAATLAGDVMALGPLAQGIDDIMWSYDAGVWRPNRNVVRDRISRVLGERHRRGHNSTVEDIVRATVDTIACDPISGLINFRNGLLDWRTGELRPHTPAVQTTVQLAVEYDATADCPAFEKFLLEVLPADMLQTAWELVGYLMYAGNPLHKAVMLTGDGRNGKGTFLRVLLELLGRRNVTSISLHDLMNTRFSTASLFGKLANIAGDIDAGYLENTATFKGITGGDTISAEHKGRDRFDFTPWAVPVFSANKIPASADTTVGYLSRWLVVHFPNSFAGREDRSLDARLHQREELAGVAARGVAALAGLLDRGDFPTTESGKLARDEFVRRVDQVQTWLFDCTVLHPDLPWVNRTELYEAYKRWAARDGHRPVRATEFYDRLEAAGAVPATVHGSRGFKGIRVVDNGFIYAPGAAGAGVYNPGNQGAAAPQGASTVAAPNADPAETATADPEDSAAAAPDPKSALTWENTQTGQTQGAEGAATPHPPSAHTRVRGVRDLAAPSAPNQIGGSEPTKTELARIAKAEARIQLLDAAAGPAVPFPAMVLRQPGGATSVLSFGLADADALLATITGTDAPLTVDIENTGYPVGHQHYALRTVQLGNDAFSVNLDPDDPEQAGLVRRHLEQATWLHAHSSTADGVPLTVAGLVDWSSFWDRMHDTVIPAKLGDPQLTGSDPGLKEISAAVLGAEAVSTAALEGRKKLFGAGKWLMDTDATTPLERSGWAQVDSRCTTMQCYAGADVLDTAAIAKRLPPIPANILARERLAQRMTARIALDGLPLDADHVDAKHAEHTQARGELAGQLRDRYGIDKPGSAAQIVAKLTELNVGLPRTKPSKKFPDGQSSVAAGVLEAIKNQPGLSTDAFELIGTVLDYRHHATALSLFLETFHNLVHRGDGRIRSTIYTLGTDTGRMSSVRFNLQQLSRVGGIRACITADPGHKLISADFSGVEFRVAAALSQDPNLIRMLLEGVNMHWLAAHQVFGPDATKEDYYGVKRGNFGWLYGGRAPTLAKQMGVLVHVAQQLIDTLNQLLPGVTAWSEQVKAGLELGQTTYTAYSGRVIHLPTKAPHAAPNYEIQGTARELLVDAMVRWAGTPWGDSIMFPVHDEVVAMVPEDQADEATAALSACMATELSGVPIVADPSEPAFAWQDAA